MSKSRKRSPVFSNADVKAGEQALFRAKENRKLRRKCSALLRSGCYEDLPEPKQYGCEWASPRDGRHYWNPVNDDGETIERKEYFEKEMRK